ncbi:hypothetical protein BOTBODRAFT_167917 [Botryobasidium botryosum FD-172 SS1]|uniref:Brix domain-containing protein n=1 Tax=Botryobasidium botryosum (strain FD-172 SS1) TaxID=930990 RepID=A0A067LU55_BOTB1|nr:hypothetical protein BOTBODRAFT_167917 [Botryobasidium botryosum FD-172 SS1]
MPSARIPPKLIKNKQKREAVYAKAKRERGQEKLKRRLALAEAERKDPEAKKARIAQNVPKTLDNMRQHDPSMLLPNSSAAGPSTSVATSSADPPEAPQPDIESQFDIANDPFASYFSTVDPSIPPKVLITTSQRATRTTYTFCDELVGIFPGAEFIRRKKGNGFEMGRIAGWAAARGYTSLIVVNEDMKKPNAITVAHLPHGPTAYFKLTSVQLTKEIFGHARASPHYPELVLNNFVTRLGHSVGRMFQTLFPLMPEFEGRQVVTLHNQRDFLFFRRHRYMFKSTERAALQEIGPRFTLKLRWLKKGLPSVQNLGAAPPPLVLAENKDVADDEDEGTLEEGASDRKLAVESSRPAKTEEFEWRWKPELETTRTTFFL